MKPRSPHSSRASRAMALRAAAGAAATTYEQQQPVIAIKPAPPKISLEQLWRAFSPDERREACLSLASAKDEPGVRDWDKLMEQLARAMRFRPVFVRQRPSEEVAGWLLSKIEGISEAELRDAAIRAWLIAMHRNILIEFLEAIGSRHLKGMVIDHSQVPDLESLRRGIGAIRRTRPERVVAVYLGYLLLHADNGYFTAMPDALGAEGVDPAAILTRGQRSEPTASAKPAAHPPEHRPQALDNDSFTTFDNLLIRTTVAAAFGEEGALSGDQIEDLVEEAVHLSASRHRTLFHLGFLHALLNRAPTFHFPGENEPRRLWYFTGLLMGSLRSGAPERCVMMLDEQPQLAMALGRSTLPCCHMLLPHLSGTLVSAEKFTLLAEWVRCQVEALSPDAQGHLLGHLQDEADALLRRGRASQAALLLDLVRDAIELCERLPGDFATTLKDVNLRRRAQLFQSRGDFSSAKDILSRLSQSEDRDTVARAQGDLGLIAGGFRSLTAVLPRPTERDNRSLYEALERGKRHFEAAVAISTDTAAKSHLCLGFLSMFSSAPSAGLATDHLGQAVEGMLRDEGSYLEGGLIDWGRLCHAIAVLESLDSSILPVAQNLVDRALASSVRFPRYLWIRLLRAASVFDDTGLAEQTCHKLTAQLEGGIHEVLAETGLHLRSRALRAVYLEWLRTGTLGVVKRWEEYQKVLRAALADQSLEQAQNALDGLEGLAETLPEQRAQFIAMLEAPNEYSPAWEPSDADMARVRLYEQDNNFAQAARILMQRVHPLRGDPSAYQIAEARSIVRRLESYKLTDLSIEHLRSLVTDAEAPTERLDEGGSELRRGMSVHIVYVGGNETQAALEPSLRASLTKAYPGLRLTFIFPGWTSNWNVYADQVKALLPGADAVVLNTLVRTQLGRTVRAMCDSKCPWFACTGRGKQSLRASIEEAAVWAADRKSESRA